ncbi:hypothetical protein [Actinobacillus equuli]|uniref:hypothetical protein n=1 Tax=Actinobacillus equuli TaxID=718 RepID=UPI002442FD68|nr:hypothetical protein [Actinobacillus equuli]WGE60754.1 hypothetical protein NYR74_08660 [Actinobacillus equuli subsp. haemolyticus]
MKSKSLVVAMATMLALSTEADASKLASELATTARYYPSATNSYNKYSSMYSDIIRIITIGIIIRLGFTQLAIGELLPER